MIKKWSYVAAAMLTASSGLVLTGCIDNDEPYGIEQIRVATANLLEAKKAAEQADAEATKAKAEIDKINAETAKLRAEIEKITAEAEAKIKEAQAKAIEAQAEADRLKAEGEKAVNDAEAARLMAEAAKAQAEADRIQAYADDIRQKTAMDIEERKKALEEFIAQAELRIKQAELAYQDALYNFEKKKATAADTAESTLWGKVESAFWTYLQKIDAYNQANKSYLDATNKMAEYDLDLVWVDAKGKPGDADYVEGHFESPSYSQRESLTKVVNELQNDIASYENTIATYQKFLEDLDAFQQSEWAQLLAEYEEKLDAAEVALKQAQLEQQSMMIDQADIFSKPDEVKEQIEKVRIETITIPTFTVDPIDELSAINAAWSNPITIVGPNGPSYRPNPSGTTGDANNVYWVDSYSWYTSSKKVIVDEPVVVKNNTELYDYWILQFTLSMFDENDKAWTEATRAELQRFVDNAEPYATAKANWEMAKLAYNKGGVPDASALPLYEEVEAAVAAYNALENKITEARETLTAAKEARAQAVVEYDKANAEYKKDDHSGTSAYDVYQTALAAWVQKQDDAREANRNARLLIDDEEQLGLKKIDNQAAILDADQKIAQANAIAAEAAAAAAPADEALQTAAKTAREDADKATKAWTEFKAGMDEAKQAVSEKAMAARDEADNTLDKALAEADKEKLQAEKAFIAAGGDKILDNDPAYKPVAEALAALEAAEKALVEASQPIVLDNVEELILAINEAVENQYKKMGYDSYFEVWSINPMPYKWMVEDYVNEYTDKFPKAVAPVMYLNDANQVYTNAKDYVVEASNVAYGGLTNSYDKNEKFTWDTFGDEALLIDEVTVETLNMYITKMLLATGWKPELITPQVIAQYYNEDLAGNDGLFGEFGRLSSALYQISCANICLADGANNAIVQQIDKLTKSRDEMNAVCKAQMEKLENLVVDWLVATEDAQNLETIAQNNVTKAQDAYNSYSNIVTLLKPFVEEQAKDALKDYSEDDIQSIEELKKAMKQEKESAEKKLAGAKIELEKAQYQLQKYEEEGGYASLENPYTYWVNYLKEKVAIAEEDMNFWKARYEALQAKYDAATKQ